MPMDVITLIGLFIVILVALILLSGIRVVKEWERLPVLRLGRYVGLRGPGITYVIPFIESVPYKVSTRIDVMSFSTEQTLTRDNVPVNVDAVMYFKPVDVEKCVLNVEDYIYATQWAAQTTLREVIGKVELNELLTQREKIGAHLREIIDEKTEVWGVKVLSVEIKDVVIPAALQDAMSRQAQAERERLARVTLAEAEYEASMQDAMSRQAQAERERLARVTLAEAEYEASMKMIEAAKKYEKNPKGLLLRWMNILYEIGRQSGSNTIMIIPAYVPEAGVPLMGILGLKEIPKSKKKSG